MTWAGASTAERTAAAGDERLKGEHRRTPRERFEELYIPEPMSGCWLWLGTARRYGVFKMRRRHWQAHRASWVLHRGPIPTESCVLHRCDTTICVNPSHLYLGTQKDNALDRERRFRGRFSKERRQ